jgi:hypothetical protein
MPVAAGQYERAGLHQAADRIEIANATLIPMQSQISSSPRSWKPGKTHVTSIPLHPPTPAYDIGERMNRRGIASPTSVLVLLASIRFPPVMCVMTLRMTSRFVDTIRSGERGGAKMGTMTDEFLKFAKQKGIKLHYVTQAENEARVGEIATALEDAGAKPGAGSLKDIAWSLYNSDFGHNICPRLPTKPLDTEDRQKIVEIRRMVRDLLSFNSTELSAIRELLEEKQASNLTKEWYTVAEAAKLTKLSQYTMRQACNHGRIEDDWKKKDIRTGKWRVHREAIAWIQNHGLSSISLQRVSQ